MMIIDPAMKRVIFQTNSKGASRFDSVKKFRFRRAKTEAPLFLKGKENEIRAKPGEGGRRNIGIMDAIFGEDKDPSLSRKYFIFLPFPMKTKMRAVPQNRASSFFSCQ